MNLALVGLCLAGLVGICVLQTPRAVPQPPPTTVPFDPANGGFVVADDELPNSPPYRGHASINPPRQQPKADIIQRIKPAIAATPAKPKPTAKTHRRPDDIAIINNKAYPIRTYKALMTPDDPSASQWWVSNTNLDEAWDIPAGDDPSLLAIIDTGFALQHEEFAGRWHSNGGETGVATSEGPSTLNCTDRALPIASTCNLVDEDADGIVDNESGEYWWYENPSVLNCSALARPLAKDCNRLDDDGNDLVDDVSGWDFVNNDRSVQAGENNPLGDGTTHGTRVAGVAAATGNNGKGIAGADWQARILPLQALDDDGYGDTLGVGRSIYYAIEQGADVISISLGSTYSDEYVREAIAMAISQGIVVVAATGNDACECVLYPAGYPEVLAVGALGTDSLPASFSSFGTNLDLLAPGVGMTSSTWTQADPTSAYANNIAGTSFATPLVSGLLARMISTQPDAKPLQLIAALTENTDRMTLPDTTPRSKTLGYGRLDAHKAADRVVTPRSSAMVYRFTPVSRGDQLNGSLPAEPAANYRVQRCETGTSGSTPLYELIKGNLRFFSVSQAEVWAAQRTGYTATLFAEVCLQQPQDTAIAVRDTDIFKEFRNIYSR